MAERNVKEGTSNKKGSPSDTEKYKADSKPGKDGEGLTQEDEVTDKFLEEDGEIPDSLQTNPNRNTDKTKTGGPSYSSKS
jgi:hypothetical protein